MTTHMPQRDLPKGMTPVKGDQSDPASVRQALVGLDTVFVLVAVSPSELMQALVALDLAHEAHVGNVVFTVCSIRSN